MNRKIKKYLTLGTLVIISILGIGIIAYKNYTSIENQSKRALRDDISSWYYPSKSIAYSNPSQQKNQSDKDKAVDLFRISHGLDTDWQFVSETYDFNYLGYSAVVIDATYLFEKESSNEEQLFKDTFYYDLDEPIPVPLIQNTTSINNKEKFEQIDKSTLWNGDFDSWCIKSN